MARGFYNRDRDDREYTFVGDINEPVAIFNARDFSDIEYKVDVTKDEVKSQNIDIDKKATDISNVTKNKEVDSFNWTPFLFAGGIIAAALLLKGLMNKNKNN